MGREGGGYLVAATGSQLSLLPTVWPLPLTIAVADLLRLSFP